ncbi:MAG: transcription termination/antitermination protein NusG [Chlamydiia bacterium]
MHKWYVVQVLAGQEKKAKKNIEEFRVIKGMSDFVQEALIPVENVAEVKAGLQKITERRIWPGYILVKMILNDETWMYIKNSNGVLGFLGGEKPQPLDDLEVQQLLADLAQKATEVTHKHQFEVGDRVKIIDGFFVNFAGVVTDVNLEKGRLSVRVNIFGRDTKVDDLEFTQVEHVPDEEADA